MRVKSYNIIMYALLLLIVPSHAIAQSQESGPVHMRACNQKGEIHGLWQLIKLYEDPIGEMTADRKKHPNQYIQFIDNGVYYQEKPENRYTNYHKAVDGIKKNSGPDVWQYIMGEQGVIYYYKNQVFSHSVYCAIVTKSSEHYRKGTIVITPTDAEETKAYQTYRKVHKPKRKRRIKRRSR